MEIFVKRLTRSRRFSKKEAYKISEDTIRINNDGVAAYQIYKKRGRPKNIYFDNEMGRLYISPGNLFFYSEVDIETLFSYGQKMKIMTWDHWEK